MSNDNANIERVSSEEIQEFKKLDLFNLTWAGTNGRVVFLAYDPLTHEFVVSYGTTSDGGIIPSNANVYYGEQDDIEAFLGGDLSKRPSLAGHVDGDGVIASALSTGTTIKKFDYFDVIIDGLGVDEYVYVGNILEQPATPTLQEVTDTGSVTTTDVTMADVTADNVFAPNVISNNNDIYSSTPKVRSAITLTQAEYDGIATPDPEHIYFIIG